MATLTNIARDRTPNTDGTRNVACNVDGNRYRLDGLVPQAEVDPAAWLMANGSSAQQAAWSAHAAELAADGLPTTIPDSWLRTAMTFADLPDWIRGLLKLILIQINISRVNDGLPALTNQQAADALLVEMNT